MRVSLGSYATAGVALVGASVIAITPVAAPVPDEVRVASPAVQLSAAVDPITPWLAVFNASEVNLANLVNSVLAAPAPVLQQVIANQIGYLGQIPDFEAIVGQMAANLQAAIRTPFAADPSTLEDTTPLMNHRSLFNILSDLMEVGAGPLPAELQPLMDFSTTYTSGVLLGLVGPVIGPMLALAASAGATFENLAGEAPDLEAAFSTLINTPAAMADAFLNGGQTLDLTPLLDAIGLNLSPAPGTDVDGVGITFGGLLSPGGSIFNALAFDINIGGFIEVPMSGNGPGAVGSLIGLSQAIAKAIGWGGEGNPLAPPAAEAEAEAEAEAKDLSVNSASVLKSPTVTLHTETNSDVPQVVGKTEETTDVPRSLKRTSTPTGSADASESATRNGSKKASAKTSVTKTQTQTQTERDSSNAGKQSAPGKKSSSSTGSSKRSDRGK